MVMSVRVCLHAAEYLWLCQMLARQKRAEDGQGSGVLVGEECLSG